MSDNRANQEDFKLEDQGEIFRRNLLLPNQDQDDLNLEDQGDIFKRKISSPSKDELFYRQEEIAAPMAGAIGATIGAGVGASKRKDILSSQEKTKNILAQITSLIEKGDIDQARNIAQIHFGNGELKFAPDEGRTAGEKWSRNVTGQVYGGNAPGVTEQAQAYQRAKGRSPVMKDFYKMFPPAAPGEPSSTIERLIERGKAAEELAKTKASNLEEIRRLASEAQVKSGLEAGEGVLGKVSQAVKQFPKTTGAVMGGLGAAGAAASGIEAAESYQQNDIPMFVMNALQAIGSGLSAFPATAIPAAIATTGIAGISALEKGRRQEALKNIPAKRRFEAMPKPVIEEINLDYAGNDAFISVDSPGFVGPAVSRRGLGYRFP
jgi:hypothetical protein